MASLTSVVKLGDIILRSPTLSKIFVPVAQTFCDFSGYRKMGLRFDDLISEESDVMQKAISRLPAQESYARNFRILTAHQSSLSHHLLPKDKQIKPEEDVPYLLPYILEAEKEAFEKKELDNLVITKK